MKKIYGMVLFVILFLALGCQDDDENLTPSGHEKQWMVIENTNPNDPVDLLRYQIYNEYGISTYYNDTIGQEKRVNMIGENYMYHEVLKVYYNPGGMKPKGSFNLLGDHAVLESILLYLKDHVFSELPREMHLPAFLFVKQINGASSQDSYMGFNTMVVRTEMNFASFDPGQKAEYGRTIITGLFAGLLQSSQNATWLKRFLKISPDVNPNCTDMYSVGFWKVTVEDACVKTNLDRTLAALGFLVPMQPSSGPEAQWYVPTKEQDLYSYLDLVFRYTLAEVTAIYGTRDVVMCKYKMVREKVESYGYKVR